MISKNRIFTACALALAATQAYSQDSLAGEKSCKLAIVNYASKPVYATSANIPVSEIYAELGLAPETPIQAVTSGGQAIPVLPGVENGEQVARFFLSLKEKERVDLTIQPAKAWSDPIAKSDFTGAEGEMSNGILSFQLRNGKWSLSFVAPASEVAQKNRVIIKDCWLDFWLDPESRGRLLGMKEDKIREMGLIPGAESKLLRSESKVNPDGSVSLELQRGFEGKASPVVLHETYTLLAGQPVLIYQSRFTTSSKESWYVANVEHGAGMRGTYGNLLKSKLQFKYDNPKEPSRVMLYGKENGFTRVGWRSERCWVGVDGELGCGIGFSTLKSITRSLPGTVVWPIGADFFLRLIDQEQENYPYQFSADKPLEMGLAFLASCGNTSIWNQTRHLFKDVTSGKTPTVKQAYAAYLNGKPLEYAEVSDFEVQSSDLPVFLIENGSNKLAALEIDFQRGYNLHLQARGASLEKPVTVSAYTPRRNAPKVEIAKLTNEDPIEVDFTKTTGWLGKRQKFILETDSSPEVILEKLSLKPQELPGPELGSPSDGLNMTDIATFFRWKQVKGAVDYEIQLSRKEDFSDPVELHVRSEVAWPYYMPKDSELPQPGKWFWRIRGLENGTPGAWSLVRTFTINNDLSKKPAVFSITPQKPLFTIEAYAVKDFSLFRNTIPADLKPSVAVNCAWSYADAKTKERIDPLVLLKPLNEENVTAFVRTHGPAPISEWLPISDLEEIFQKFPNVIGNMGGETLSAHFKGGDNQTYVNRVLKLCGKYGRLFYDADGTYPAENKWQVLYEKEGTLMKEYGDYLIFAQKNNILHRQFVSQSSVLGLYLSDAISNQGAWEDGGWYWQQTGFRRLGEILGQRAGDSINMPRNFWNLNFLMGIARGCAVFSFEGQCGSLPVPKNWKIAEKGFPPNRENHMAYWTTQGELTPTFHRYLAPFMRAVIKKQLVPSKEEVLKNIRLVSSLLSSRIYSLEIFWTPGFLSTRMARRFRCRP